MIWDLLNEIPKLFGPYKVLLIIAGFSENASSVKFKSALLFMILFLFLNVYKRGERGLSDCTVDAIFNNED